MNSIRQLDIRRTRMDLKRRFDAYERFIAMLNAKPVTSGGLAFLFSMIGVKKE